MECMCVFVCIRVEIVYTCVGSSHKIKSRLAGERVGRSNEVGEWGDMCYNTYRLVSKLIVTTINCSPT